MPVDERTFAADVTSQINEILAERPALPFERAYVEDHVADGRKRHDLILTVGATGEAFLTGEIKMPDQPGGKSPWDGALIEDAFEKAIRRGVPYYFTWNVREFLLFRTHRPDVPFIDRQIREPYQVADVTVSDDVRRADVRSDIRDFLGRLLDDLAAFRRGVPIRNLPPDRRFVPRLEAALDPPVTLTNAELQRRYGRGHDFRESLDHWMRDQGWEVSRSPEAVRANLDRAARLSCYVFLNRMVFYEVIRRHFQQLPPLSRPHPSESSEEYGVRLRESFQEAIQTSHDYETIFSTQDDFEARLPFIAEGATTAWASVVANIEEFDLTTLPYDVIGGMYEALIGPHERRRYGQFFTSPQVVDLINAFCIREPDAHVLDPACGGGTFLVRAYARKQVLAEREGFHREHRDVLRELTGLDIAAVPAQLATINLAVRHLTAEPNYPRVVQKDFFKAHPAVPIAFLPVGDARASQKARTMIQDIDAVVGNPPYVRQEEISREDKSALRKISTDAGASLSGRCDLYVHFFTHAAAFMRDDAYVGLVTGIGWLDTAYGEGLHRYFLENFRVVAVMESQVEKWFEDARVTTAVTILCREKDADARAANLVRFAQLRKPLAEIYTEALSGRPTAEDERTRQADMDAVRELIEEMTEDGETDYWRIRVVKQGALAPGK